MTGPDVADLSPGSVLIAGTTGWRYRVQAADCWYVPVLTESSPSTVG